MRKMPIVSNHPVIIRRNKEIAKINVNPNRLLKVRNSLKILSKRNSKNKMIMKQKIQKKMMDTNSKSCLNRKGYR